MGSLTQQPPPSPFRLKEPPNMPNERRKPYRPPFLLEDGDHIRLARTVVFLWRLFTKRKILRRSLALSGIRNFLADNTDDCLARTILALVVQFQVKHTRRQAFEDNPHKESRQRAIRYFRERTRQHEFRTRQFLLVGWASMTRGHWLEPGAS